ncbi:hypothetical protein DFH09DRAFT_1439748 [Mycena vulgaris]|nr:hypothetical protein DFH09DRAFT_1439748 [Mycena vulgaris]
MDGRYNISPSSLACCARWDLHVELMGVGSFAFPDQPSIIDRLPTLGTERLCLRSSSTPRSAGPSQLAVRPNANATSPTPPPAIRCTDLTPDDGAADGLRFVSRAALNFTTQDRYHGAGQDLSVPTDQCVLTVGFVPYVNEGALINAAGAMCVFHNATHEAHTHSFNGTQEISVSVAEIHDALSTTFKNDSFNKHEGLHPGRQQHRRHRGRVARAWDWRERATFAMVDALNNMLSGSISRDLNTGRSPRRRRLNFFTGVTSFSNALQDLLANATLGFIPFNAGFTTVPPSVPSTDNVYVFNPTVLGATYLVAFAILLRITIAGVFALIANGEPSENRFSALLVTTRIPHLLPPTEAVKADPGLTRDATGSARLIRTSTRCNRFISQYGGAQLQFGVKAFIRRTCREASNTPGLKPTLPRARDGPSSSAQHLDGPTLPRDPKARFYRAARHRHRAKHSLWSVRDRSTSQCYDVGSYTFWHQRAKLEVTWGGFMLSLLPFRQSFIIPRSFDVRTGFIAAPTPSMFA